MLRIFARSLIENPRFLSKILFLTLISDYKFLATMKRATFSVASILLVYFVSHSEGFGVPFFGSDCIDWNCFANEKKCVDNALIRLDDNVPVTTVYLDFDKTITVNDFSSEVRGRVCGQKEYPDCVPEFDDLDSMVNIDILICYRRQVLYRSNYILELQES